MLDHIGLQDISQMTFTWILPAPRLLFLMFMKYYDSYDLIRYIQMTCFACLSPYFNRLTVLGLGCYSNESPMDAAIAIIANMAHVTFPFGESFLLHQLRMMVHQFGECPSSQDFFNWWKDMTTINDNIELRRVETRK